MALFIKITPSQIFWICIFYGSGIIVLLSTFGSNYLLIPKITRYKVGDDDVEITLTTLRKQLISAIEDNVDMKGSFEKSLTVGYSSHSRDEWKPRSINASYVSVPDEQVLNFHCNVCAIVTNSGQLLGKGAGSYIDQSDCIFRMNNAPTRGFENDVGSRTDVRIIGHSNLIKDDFKYNKSLVDDLFSSRINGNPSLVLVPWLFHKELNKTENPSYLMVKNLSLMYPDVKFHVSTPEWVSVSEDFFKVETGITRAEAHTWLSTGWMTILFAIESCDTVNVYGMVSEQHCMNLSASDAPYHYYASGINDTKECYYYLKSESSLTYGHKLITEKAVFARWSTRNDLNFYYPAWENISVTDSSSKLETLFLQLYKDEPLRRKQKRRERMMKLREKFKNRYAKKKFKIIHRHGTRNRITIRKART